MMRTSILLLALAGATLLIPGVSQSAPAGQSAAACKYQGWQIVNRKRVTCSAAKSVVRRWRSGSPNGDWSCEQEFSRQGHCKYGWPDSKDRYKREFYILG